MGISCICCINILYLVLFVVVQDICAQITSRWMVRRNNTHARHIIHQRLLVNHTTFLCESVIGDRYYCSSSVVVTVAVVAHTDSSSSSTSSRVSSVHSERQPSPGQPSPSRLTSITLQKKKSRDSRAGVQVLFYVLPCRCVCSFKQNKFWGWDTTTTTVRRLVYFSGFVGDCWLVGVLCDRQDPFFGLFLLRVGSLLWAHFSGQSSRYTTYIGREVVEVRAVQG